MKCSGWQICREKEENCSVLKEKQSNERKKLFIQTEKDGEEGERNELYKAAPVRAPFSLFKVEQTISRFYSESKVYLIKHST